MAALPIDHAGSAPVALAEQVARWSPEDTAQFAVALVGLLVALLALPRVFQVSSRTLTQKPHARWIGLALLVGLVLRLVVPGRLVMLFSGYELVDKSAILLAVHRYGAGSQVLHRLLFTFLPPDHATLIGLHRVVGSLALVPLLAWFARWSPSPRALVLAAFSLATLPLSVRDAATESILVIGAFWLWSGLLLLAEEGLSWRAAGLLAAAAMTRPELLVVAPVLAWLQLRRDQRRPGPIAVTLFAVLAAPQLYHIVDGLVQDAEAGTHRIDRIFPLGPLAALGSFLPFWPLAFPVAWTLLALTSWRDKWLRSLLLTTYLWTIALLIDLPKTSVPRLEAPIAVLWLLVGVSALDRLAGKRRHVVALLVVLTMLPGLTLFVTQNEDDSERFTRAAIDKLPPRACLVTLHESDPPDKGKVQRAFPDYLLRPPHRPVARYALQQWQDAGAPQCPGGTFLLLEHRCYAIFHHPPDAPPQLPVCTQILAAHPWQPVMQEQAPNHGQNEYGWYPDVPSFQLGLYRLNKPDNL